MDSGCRKLTAAWVREAAQKSHDVETCDFFEGLERAAADAVRLFRLNAENLYKHCTNNDIVHARVVHGPSKQIVHRAPQHQVCSPHFEQPIALAVELLIAQTHV